MARLRVLYLSVFIIFLGQQTLNPLIAPLAREVGLADWQVGVMISTSAIVVVLTSQFWGRRSAQWGRKPVLVGALTGATVAMLAFAVLAHLGIAAVLSGALLFGLFVLTRGVLFGVAFAAVPPTAQAYAADATETERDRLAAMAAIGASQGIAMIAGAGVGGLLGGFGMLTPLYAVPLILAVGAVLVAVLVKPQDARELVAAPPRVRPLDRRVWPYLLTGFGMFTALGFVQILIGFLLQDRNGLSATQTAGATGGTLLAAGVGMLLAQVVIVPRAGWPARRLMRAGALVALGGLALLLPDIGLPVFVAAVLIIGLGLGLAIPGYTAGPTFAMTKEEQGGLAGVVAANNALTFVLAPTLATALYALSPLVPLVTAVAIMCLVIVLLYAHPLLRHDGARPEEPAEARQG
ncbi:MFS transporter [Nonomuraea endophytica]|uniref:MFS family permease n=1 Tax=Nonomuraea endophytica TaxID=714136 RepID=A0A7W8A4H0_9ACTN|nr:MFS transporter [Nonomuraea endophytica]MBB5079363.1 MFS family permease [Nonomuraea endophytica]